jgi:hypothetical protein
MSPLHEKYSLNNFRLLDNVNTQQPVVLLFYTLIKLALTQLKCKTLTDGISDVSQQKPK